MAGTIVFPSRLVRTGNRSDAASRKERSHMKKFHTALGLSSFLAIAGATLMVPTVASAQPAADSYVACNGYGDCWRVHHVYAYGEAAPIRYYNADWYDAHRADEHVHWV